MHCAAQLSVLRLDTATTTKAEEEEKEKVSKQSAQTPIVYNAKNSRRYCALHANVASSPGRQ